MAVFTGLNAFIAKKTLTNYTYITEAASYYFVSWIQWSSIKTHWRSLSSVFLLILKSWLWCPSSLITYGSFHFWDWYILICHEDVCFSWNNFSWITIHRLQQVIQSFINQTALMTANLCQGWKYCLQNKNLIQKISRQNRQPKVCTFWGLNCPLLLLSDCCNPVQN